MNVIVIGGGVSGLTSSIVIAKRNSLPNSGHVDLKQYIPFYFGPRSPMLYVIQKGHNGVTCYHPSVLVYCIVRLSDIREQGIDCMFTDGHAFSAITRYYSKEDLGRINEIINKEDVYAKFWNVEDDLDLKRLEYDWEVNAGFSMHKLGEAFKWGREAHSNDFTVKVTSIKEQNSTNGISEDYWNWITDYSLIHSDFFDENGKLITPYTRHDINDSDGVNTQRKEWDTEDERHFFSVTVEITQSTDSPYADFDVMGDFSPVILIKDKDGSYHHNGEEDKNGVTQRIIYGNIDTVLSTPGDEVNVLHMSKGETRTLTYGIVVDDDVLDNAYLRFNSSDDEVIDDKAETITLNYHNDCVRIKE